MASIRSEGRAASLPRRWSAARRRARRRLHAPPVRGRREHVRERAAARRLPARRRRRRRRGRESPARFDVPVVTRGAGTSLAGQTAGQGHRARHLAPHGRDRRDRRRAARARASAPASCRTTLNRAVKPHGLGFGPDTSTSNRATLGGMIGNNSSGSHSIVYGTTIDHVHELEVVLTDGSTADLRAGRRGGAARRARTRSRAASTAACRRSCATTRARSPRTTRKHWRQSGGYRLDRSPASSTSPSSSPAPRARSSRSPRRRSGLIELPKARQFAVGHFHSVDEAIAATEDALELRARRRSR